MPKKPAKSKEKTLEPEVSIGLVGHVDHGKTTLTERLSGKWTDTHSEEIKRGITIRLGYANATFYKCSKCKILTSLPNCPKCSGKTKPLRKVSFVDAPGHESLMATMLSGATIMDGALLITAADETCPQPQTIEHLKALEIIGVKNIVIVQNKIDLVTEEEALKNYEEIKELVKGTPFEKAPIIPVSAKHKINLEILIQAIEDYIPTPKREKKKEPLMFVARSFDINKPGSKVDKLVGGVLGGAVKQGEFKVGDEIEIKPGREVLQANQKVWEALTTEVTGLHTGEEVLEKATPGGSIAMMTQLDPSIVKSDKLAGAVVGLPGKLPPVWSDLKMEVNLLDRVVGAKDKLVVKPITANEILMLNVNSAATVGVVGEMKKKAIKCKLKIPVCADIGSRVTISRQFGNRWRLIGFGVIKE